MSRKILTMTIEVTFEGDYYEAGELPQVTSDWIDGGLCDRSDLTGWIVRSSSVEITDPDKEGR